MDDTVNLSVNELMTFASATFDRMLMARALGQTAYEGDRDYYEVLGYPEKITFSEYMQRYERQDIASRIIELPARDTWKKPPQISEDDNTETPFVKEWELLVKRLRVWSMLSRADVLSGIGRFGILLIGVRDDTDMKEPVMDIDKPGDSKPLSGQKDILYLRPLAGDEVNVKVDTVEKDSTSPRFGLPLTYSINLVSDDQSSRIVHWTRVLHLAENKTHSEIYGLPRLQRIFNRLDDMMKLIGGTAEATWLNMRPGVMIGAKEGFSLGDIEETKAAWLKEVRRYVHDPNRFLRMIGAEAQSLGTGQIMDPTGPFNVELSLISAASGIPQRVLIGSAKGELAAAREDMRQWAGTIAERQTNYAEQEILRPLIDRLVLFGALPMPGVGLDGYDIGTLDNKDVRRWPSLFEQTEAEEAEVRRLDASSTRLVSSPETGKWVATEQERRAMLGLPEEPEVIEQEEPEQENIIVQQVRGIGLSLPIPDLGNERTNQALNDYANNLTRLAARAQGGDIERDEFEEELTALIIVLSFALFQIASGKTAAEMTTEDLEIIKEYQGQNIESVPSLAEAIYTGRFVDPETGKVNKTFLNMRLTLWAFSALGLAGYGMLSGNPEQNFRWDLGATFEHCTDCARLDGQVHSGREWLAAGWRPQSRRLECTGRNCDCRTVPTRAEARGSF